MAALLVGCGKAKESVAPASPSTNSLVASNAEFSDQSLRQGLVGSWRSWANPQNGGLLVMDTTYNLDGSWTWSSDSGAFESPRQTLSVSGLWRVTGGYLYVRGTNSVGTTIDSNKDVRHEFLTLTDVECTTRANDGSQRRMFRKGSSDGGARIPSDAELQSLFVGKWRTTATNNDGSWYVGTASYNADGTAAWAADFGKNSSDSQKYQAGGFWRVDRGYFCDLVTNAVGGKSDATRWDCEELLTVTATEITYRNASGRVNTDTRQ